jgi:uncharacterized Zn finger protein
MDYLYGWKPYVSVAARRRQAERELATLRKKGRTISPVLIEGRTIAATFWGKAWCTNLERYSDFANRLPRGRTYVRNGSVVDLQIASGAVTALVSGSELYEVRIGVAGVAKTRWRGICRDCSGAIDSVVALLQGTLSAGVMTRLCAPQTGLFPEPRDLSFDCSCPDWASMCKHVAAVLYGVGARFDERPELLFLLRGVRQDDLIVKAGADLGRSTARSANGKVLESANLSEMFGIEIAAGGGAGGSRRAKTKRTRAGSATITPAARAAASATARPAPPTPAPANSRARGQGRRAADATPIAPAVPRPKKRRTFTAAERRAVAERMKKYWAERRKTPTRTKGK